MSLTALGYLTVRSEQLVDWDTYGQRLLGLELAEKTRETLKFRMDDRKQRIIVASGADAVDAVGWEAESAAAVDIIAARVEAVKIRVERMSGGDCAQRGVAAGVWFFDPAGNRLEVVSGPEVADRPMRPGRPISGFRTGALGMGHAVLYVKRIEDVRWFYEDVLGFRLSDYTLKPFKAFFFHINGRHHSVALIEGGNRRIHHIMMELMNLDDVGQGYDLLQQEPEKIATTLGRHTNDFMTSFYARTPSDFFIEYGWGGRVIDPATWQPQEMHYGPSLWGHDRTWLPAEALAEARAFRARAAEDGLRAPVQVSDGNFRAGLSDCPWWETVRK